MPGKAIPVASAIPDGGPLPKRRSLFFLWAAGFIFFVFVAFFFVWFWPKGGQKTPDKRVAGPPPKAEAGNERLGGRFNATDIEETKGWANAEQMKLIAEYQENKSNDLVWREQQKAAEAAWRKVAGGKEVRWNIAVKKVEQKVVTIENSFGSRGSSEPYLTVIIPPPDVLLKDPNIGANTLKMVWQHTNVLAIDEQIAAGTARKLRQGSIINLRGMIKEVKRAGSVGGIELYLSDVKVAE
jgi:hypothetical protein